MDDKKNKQRIRARLKKRFSYVTNLTTISVVVAAMIFVGVRYNYALQNYGFVQSDVGEAGKGFAVVADQIRQLAEQSAKSAVDTHELIAGILKEIAEVMQSNSAAAEETSATSEELSAQAETLQGLVSKFTLH